MSDKCKCDGPGYCKLLRRPSHDPPEGRYMSEVRWRECRDKPAYFEMFRREADRDLGPRGTNGPVRPARAESPESGPGTELKAILVSTAALIESLAKWIPITSIRQTVDTLATMFRDSPDCPCRGHARTMDLWGPAKCRENLGTIVGWLRTEATRRGLPFADVAAKQIVLHAIRKAETKAEQSREDSHPFDRGVVGVTTCDRPEPTLAATLDSLAAAGWSRVHVFADGACDVPAGYDVTRRGRRLGAWPNWWLALHEMYQRAPHAEYYLILQDDVRFAANVREYLERVLFGQAVYSLYHSCRLSRYHLDANGDRWVRYTGGRGFIGALALLFPRGVLRHLLSTSIGVDHRVEHRGTDYIDGTLGRWCRDQGVPLYVHIPSLVQHTGRVSTLGHRERDSESFVEDDPALADGEPPEIRAVLPGRDDTQYVRRRDGQLVPCQVRVSQTRREPALSGQAAAMDAGRIAVIGWNTASGLGYLNRDLAACLPAKRFAVVQHPRFPRLGDVPGVECMDVRNPEDVLRGIDTLVMTEIPYLQGLPSLARSMGVRTVLVVMLEGLPLKADWLEHIDLFVCPTRHCYAALQHPPERPDRCVYVPWPAPLHRITFRRRTVCRRFVFVQGTGGYKDRKGAEAVAAAARLCPEIPIVVYSQMKHQQSRRSSVPQWPVNVEQRGMTSDPDDLYDDTDAVLLLPSRWEGLGMQFLEAGAAGMPIVTTEGGPMDEYEPLRVIPSSHGRTESWSGRVIGTSDADPEAIAQIMRELYGTDLSGAGRAARAFAESRTWDPLRLQISRPESAVGRAVESPGGV